jgi:signal transduction histidine kinase
VEAVGGESDAGRGGVQSPLFGGRIRVGTESEDGRVYLRIADSGPGISQEDLETVFDPFYTRKKPMGMGVGLSICHGVMEEHNGTIRAENGSSGGAVFTLMFPAL